MQVLLVPHKMPFEAKTRWNSSLGNFKSVNCDIWSTLRRNQVTRLKLPKLIHKTSSNNNEVVIKTCTKAIRVFSNKSYCLSFAWSLSIDSSRKIICNQIGSLSISDFFLIGKHLTAIFISNDFFHFFRCREIKFIV